MIKYQGHYYNPYIIVSEGDAILGDFKLIGDKNPRSKGLLVRTYQKGVLVGFERINTSHKEVCCFKSKLMRPSEWIVIQL